MPAYLEIGDAISLSWLVEVDEVPTNATVVLTVTLPDGTTTTPSVSNPSTGNYAASLTATQSGIHRYRWVATGAVVQADSGTFTVGGIGLEEVKDALNITSTSDDGELTRYTNAALRHYARHVRLLPGTYANKRFDGGGSLIVLPPDVTAVTAASYTDGTTIDVDDFDFDTETAILRWDYNTAGYFTSGTRNVLLTYTVGPIPEDHEEAILADVAGLYAFTQRPSGSQAASFPGEGYGEPLAELPRGLPVTLFPRILALAPPVIG